jgi:hypothetical protein
MSRLKIVVLTAFLAFAAAPAAWADCVYQGKSYPTGTKIGGLTCQADGTWR